LHHLRHRDAIETALAKERGCGSDDLIAIRGDLLA